MPFEECTQSRLLLQANSLSIERDLCFYLHKITDQIWRCIPWTQLWLTLSQKSNTCVNPHHVHMLYALIRPWLGMSVLFWARCWCAIRKMSVMALVQRLVTGERWYYIIICLCLDVYASPLAVVCVGFVDEWGFLSCLKGHLREVLHQVLYSRVNSKCQWSP